MVVEDKEGMGLATGGVSLFHRLFQNTPAHGCSAWLDTIMFYSDFSSFLLLSVTKRGGDPAQ